MEKKRKRELPINQQKKKKIEPAEKEQEKEEEKNYTEETNVFDILSHYKFGRKTVVRQLLEDTSIYQGNPELKKLTPKWKRMQCRNAINKPNKKNGYVQIVVNNKLKDLIKEADDKNYKETNRVFSKTSNRGTLLHRLVTLAYRGPPPHSSYEASHLCNNRLCVNHYHLIWETSLDNQRRKNCIRFRKYKHRLLDVCPHDPPCKDYSFIKTKEDLKLYKKKKKTTLLPPN